MRIDPALEGEAALEPAGPSDLSLEIPPLRQPTPLYDTFDELFAALQIWGRNNGAAFVKSRSHRQTLETSMVVVKKAPAYYVVLCDHGPSRLSRGSGLRSTSSQKIECPFTIVASATKKNH